MPRRSFDDSYWGDPFVQELDKDSKLLFAYLWTNKRCNSAGLYEITIKTIAFETGIELDNIPVLIERLSEKVKWIKDSNIIWVKNFLKHQPKSPLFLKSVEGCLNNICSNPSNNGIIQEYGDYYSRLGVSILYSNGIVRVSKGLVNLTELELEHDIEQEQGIPGKHKYGEFKNVLLSDGERVKLVERFGESSFNEKVEEMSLAIGSKGYKYKSHYLAILQWDKRGQKDGTSRGNIKEDSKGKDKDYTGGKYGQFVKH